MLTAKVAMGMGAALLVAAQAGAGSGGTPVTIENIAIAFSGVILIWFGQRMLKLHDTVLKLEERLVALERHRRRRDDDDSAGGSDG